PQTTLYAFVKRISGTGTFTLTGQTFVCGDGVVDPGEECETLADAGGECCNVACQLATGTPCSIGTCSAGVCLPTPPDARRAAAAPRGGAEGRGEGRRGDGRRGTRRREQRRGRPPRRVADRRSNSAARRLTLRRNGRRRWLCLPDSRDFGRSCAPLAVGRR